MRRIFKRQPGKIKFLSRAIGLVVFAFLVVMVSYAQFFHKTDAATGVPVLINFQGKLTAVSDGSNVANGTYAIRFKLYDALTSGSLLWTETRDQAPVDACQKVQVTSGLFNVKLGSCNPLTGVDFTSDSLYLSVDFAPTGTSYDGEMSPRKQLVASAYAINANNLAGNGKIILSNSATTTDIATITGSATTTGDILTLNNNSIATTSGDLLQGSHTATYTSSASVSGNLLDLSRSLTASGGATTTTVTGAVATISDNCATASGGTCTHTGNVLALTQSYASASGAILNISGAGTGNLMLADASNSSANGVSIDIQSSSTSQYALRVTSNNGATTGLYVRGDGHVGIGTTGPDELLTLGGGSIGLDNNQGLDIKDTSGNYRTIVSVLGTDEMRLNANNVGGTAFATLWENGGEKIRFDAAGKVGIGDTGPDNLLDVMSAAATAGIAITSTGTDTDAYLKFELADNTSNFILGVDDSVAGDPFKISTTALGTSDLYVIDSTITGVASTVAHAQNGLASTLSDSASAEYTTLSVVPPTITLSGSTQVTSSMDSILFSAPTITQGSAHTVDNAATVRIVAAPIAGGSVTITNPYALWVDAGVTRLDGNLQTNVTGITSQCLHVDTNGVVSGTGVDCGTGSMTPWTSDIDADGFDLTDISNVLFRETTGAPTGTDVGFFRDNSGDLNANVLTGKTLNIQVNGTDEYNFSSSALAMNSNNITGLGTALTATAGLTISSTSADLALATATSGNITATTATTSGLFNVLTGSLKVGAGTPGLTLNGDDGYITGTFEVDGAQQFDGASTHNSTAAFNGVATFNTDVDFTLAGTENLALTNTPGTASVDLFALTLTNNDGGANTQRGIVLTNADSTSTTESLILIDNADTTASSLTDGILITSSGVNNGLTDAIDVSAANIANAMNVGANTITGAGYTIQATASGLTVTSASADLALSTTTSGNITATTVAAALFNVLTGNLQVGNGAPGVTLNGEDAYIEGTLEVDGLQQFDGASTHNSTAAFNGVATFNTDVDFVFAGTENLALTNTSGSNAVDLFALTLTNNDGGSATQRGIVLTNADSTSTSESLVLIDNADTTASSLTDGIIITSSGVNNGITEAIDVSAANIATAMNVGANPITGAGYTVQATASGLTVTSASADLALSTTTSGNITATTATTSGLFNVLTGSLKVGAGTPGVTLNGDDAYVTGTFEVDGANQFDGASTHNSTAAFNGVATFNTDVDFTFAGTENLALTNTPGTASVDLFALTLTNNDGGANTQRGIVLSNADSTSTTESLILINNADTTASSLTDGILITSSGVNNGLTDAIDVSDSNIANAMNVGANPITGAGYTITSTASGLTLNSTSANLALQTTTSGNITMAPASTGSVVLTLGTTTGTGTTAGLSLASSTLSSGSLMDLTVTGTAGASSQKVINVTTSGAITGTQTTYGGYFSNTHSGGTSTNVGLYATATGGTNNYAGIFEGGSVGIGTASPLAKLDVRGDIQVGASGAPQALNIYENGSTNGISLFNTSSGDAQVVQITQQSDGGKISLLGGNGAEFRSNGDSYFAGGNLGVGTISPGASLDVDRADASSITAEQILFLSQNTVQALSNGTTIASWRNNQFLAPTLNGIAGGGTETVTNAATLYIDAAPSGSNITITNPYALWVDAGVTRLDGNLQTNVTGSTQCLHVDTNGTVSGTSSDCGSGGATALQNSYAADVDGSDATISLTSADDSLILTNPSSSGTDSAFTLQIDQANTTAAVLGMDVIQRSNAANGVNLTANSIDGEVALNITANALTSGNGLAIASSATAFTGALAKFTASGSNAANTGSVVRIDNTGTASANVGLYIDHRATGTGNLAFRIDDSSGDTTPLVVDGDGRLGVGTSSITGSTERLLQVGSPTNRGNMVAYGDVVAEGYSKITSLTGIKDIFLYDTTGDSDGGKWIDWATTDQLSWFTETLDDGPGDPCVIASDDRCYTTHFPRKAILAVTTDSLYIFDAATGTMWMKFSQNASGYALGADTNNDPSSVTALNGVIYVGTNGSAQGGLYVIDFVNDRMWNIDGTDRSSADLGISSRNSAIAYNSDNTTAFDLSTTGAASEWEDINDVSAVYINSSSTAISTGAATNTSPGSGQTFVGLATDSGITIINMTAQKVLQYSDVTADDYTSVVLTRRARMYALNTTSDQMEMWINFDTDKASEVNGTFDARYDETVGPALWSSTPNIVAGAPDALEVIERGSLAEDTSDIVYVGHSLGLTEIHTHSTSTNGWSKFFDTTRQTMLMPNAIDMALMMDDTSGTLANDISFNNTDMTILGSPTLAVSGVRGKAMNFDNSNDYLCSDADQNGTCDVDASFNVTTTGFTISMWFKHTTTAPASGVDMLFEKCVNATPGQAIGCLAAYMTTTGVIVVGNDDDATWTQGSSYDITSTSSLAYNDNLWHQLIISRTNANDVDTFIDGNPLNLSTATGNTLTLDGSQIVTIGASCSPTTGANCAAANALNFWDGQIDDVTFSNGTTTVSTLSALQARRFYNDARPLVAKKVITVTDATTATSTTIGDSGETWIPNEFAGMMVGLTGGTGSGQTRRVVSNTTTVMTVTPAFTTTPDTTTDFEVDPEALYGASNSVIAVGITKQAPLGQARQMCIGTNSGTDTGGVTCYNHQAGPNIIADLFHADAKQLDDAGTEWTGTDFDDIRAIDMTSRDLIIGSEAHFYTETGDVRLGQALDYLANQLFNVRSELINDGITLTGSLALEVGFTGGADLAEYYYSTESLEAGDIVVIDSSGDGDDVRKSEQSYSGGLLGVVSTQPGLILGSKALDGFPIALTGRIPVKFSMENGPVKAGDYLTSASKPGYAMRATGAGPTIGKALSDSLNADEMADCEAAEDTKTPAVKCGYVTIFVEHGNFSGLPIEQLMQEMQISVSTDGVLIEDSDDGLVENDEDILDETGLENGEENPLTTDEKILVFLKHIKETKQADGLSVSAELFTDRVSAAFEIVSPQITTSGLKVETIGKLGDSIDMLGDITFFGRPYLNGDTAGFAQIKKGQTSVDVIFEKEYIEQPVVHASITTELDQEVIENGDVDEIKALQDGQDELAASLFEQGIQILVIKKSVTGFTIITNKPVPEDVTLSWIAFAVKNPKLFVNEEEPSQPEDETPAEETAAPAEEENPAETPPAEAPEESQPTPEPQTPPASESETPVINEPLAPAAETAPEPPAADSPPADSGTTPPAG